MRIKILVGLLLALAGCSSRSGPPRPPAPRPTTLHVNVISDGKPVGGAKVEVDAGNVNAGKGGTTNGDGQVMIYDLAFVGFNVCAQRDGYSRVCVPGDMAKQPVSINLERLQRPPPVNAGIAGQLRLQPGGGFVDDRGPKLPILCHFGDALSRWSRGQQGQVLALLDAVKAAGYDGIRFWTTLGSDGRPGDFWYGREVGPTYTKDGLYWAHFQALLEALRDRGLAAQISQGDTFSKAIPDRSAFVRQQAEIIGRVGVRVVALWEFGNESWQTGESDPRRAAQTAQVFRQHRPEPLIGLSSPPEGENPAALKRWSQPPANLWIIHGYRKGHWWDKVRHIFSLIYEGCRPAGCLRNGWQGEPSGPGVMVSETDNIHELDAPALQAMAAMALMTGQGWVHFSGPGIISDCKPGERINQGRYTCNGETLDGMPGFWEVPKVRDMMPADVARFPELIHGGSTWSSKTPFMAVGENRADSALSSDRFATVIYGPDMQRVPYVRGRIVSDVRLENKARVVWGYR